VSVTRGTCSPSRCRETALIYPPISRSLHNNGSTPYSSNYCLSASSQLVVLTASHEEYCFSGCNAMFFGDNPMFLRNISPPFSVPKIFLLGLIFKPKNEDDMFLRNVALYPNYMPIFFFIYCYLQSTQHTF
jgi:hypothetical protein